MHWPILLLLAIAIPLISYQLTYEPYWQDELSSLYASQGVMLRGFPFFPSGFLYEKAEFYTYLLAIWRILFSDQLPRLISALEYLASIPLLYIVGCSFFGRRVALLAAAMLALSPAALIWGRQVRMYEQAQLFTVLVMFLFYKAAQERQRARMIYLAMSCLIAAYLSHEELFIILPGLILCTYLIGRLHSRSHWTAGVGKHWWFAILLGGSIIAAQLFLAHATHPPVLGTDSSQRPFVQPTTENIPYYINLLFPLTLSGHKSWMTINSILALIGCTLALRQGNIRARYCATFLLVGTAALVLLFTMQAERYFYPLLPAYYLMGAYALWSLMGLVSSNRIEGGTTFTYSFQQNGSEVDQSSSLALNRGRDLVSPQRAYGGSFGGEIQPNRPTSPSACIATNSWGVRTTRAASVGEGKSSPTDQHSHQYETSPTPGGVRTTRAASSGWGNTNEPLGADRHQNIPGLSHRMCWLVRATVALLCAYILIIPILPLSGSSLLLSRLTGLPYHRHYPDYDAVGQYMKQHWQQGDVVISISPDISIYHYTGHVDYFLSIDRALFLFESDGHIVGTTVGARALLNQDDLQAVLSSHPRVWIISDNGTYQAQATKRFTIPADFHIVFEGYGSAVYFREGG